jgi:hypothetical protein
LPFATVRLIGARDTPAELFWSTDTVIVGGSYDAVFGPDEPFDARQALAAGVLLCEPSGDLAPEDEPCLGRGVPGLRVSAVSGGSDRPMFVSDGGVLEAVTDETLTSSTLAAWTFANAEPGELVADLVDPDGRTVRCESLEASAAPGWATGEVVPPGSARVRAIARPGFLGAAIVACAVE